MGTGSGVGVGSGTDTGTDLRTGVDTGSDGAARITSAFFSFVCNLKNEDSCSVNTTEFGLAEFSFVNRLSPNDPCASNVLIASRLDQFPLTVEGNTRTWFASSNSALMNCGTKKKIPVKKRMNNVLRFLRESAERMYQQFSTKKPT